MRNKLQSLLNNLNQGLVEREQTVKLALLTLLAGENILLIGPPGTGKSLIARRMASSLASKSQKDNDYFEYLLTKFSTPEEIFGPLSISELKRDRFKRNTAGYLPTVKTAFLDEIFKSSSSILNALLTILNERIYHNGAETQDVPLRSLIAASNELPTAQEELSALYDRFLVRIFIDYVQENSREHFFKPAGIFQINPELCITDAELAQIAAATARVEIPDEIAQAILRIWAQHKEVFKEDRREELSDRRLTKVIQLLRVSAATNGRLQVDMSDVLLLKDCLWNHQDNVKQVLDIITQELGMTVVKLIDDEPRIKNKNSNKNKKNKFNTHKKAQTKNVIKGYQGSGTELDPILIKCMQDLAGLSRSEVGQQGYYFEQTEDIDISEIKNWPEIDFIGHFDGKGHSILGSGSDDAYLFESLTESSIYNIILDDLSVARNGLKSIIKNISTSNNIFGCNIIKQCAIESCEAGMCLIKEDAHDCIINKSIAKYYIAETMMGCSVNECKSNGVLVVRYIDSSSIENCIVDAVDSSIDASFNDQNSEELCGLISSGSVSGSNIEKCYVCGNIDSEEVYSFSGFVYQHHSSTISWNMLAEIYFTDSSYEADALISRDTDTSSNLEDNYSTELNVNFRKIDATIISPLLLNKRHFETTMGWDFDDVWIWDEKENRPALRNLGPTFENAIEDTEIKQLVNFFEKQIQKNIWL